MGIHTELSLFSGYGGFSLGLRLAGLDVRTVCYVEWEEYCQRIIQARIAEGHLDNAPIWDDITTFDGKPWRGHVDIITGGFPCQPHSVAGKRRGEADERNLWPDTLRVIRDVGPSWVLLENVPGILANGYGGTVVGQLSEIGYDCVWHCVPAAAVGAPHLRWRWWCLAHAKFKPVAQDSDGGPVNRRAGETLGAVAGTSCQTVAYATGGGRGEGQPILRRRQLDPDGSGEEVADASIIGRTSGGVKSEPSSKNRRTETNAIAGCGWWAVEPDVGRVAHGVTARVDRLRATGNGIVPAVGAKFLDGAP